MSVACCLSGDEFLCSICLDVFTDPVSTPCGHNFCKKCITDHWDINVSSQCPNCKKVFLIRPELHINTLLSEMVAQFRRSAQQRASSGGSEIRVSKPGEVLCDICSGSKLKAHKACLVCLVSYCETHLEPHLTKPGLKKHELIDPVRNLEARMCTKHDRLLEKFCKTDQTCVCMVCMFLDHKKHKIVPLKEIYDEKKAELGRTGVKFQQMIRERELKIQEMKHSVKVSRKNADRELESSVQVFNKLKEAIEKKQAEVTKRIEEKHRTTKKQADDFIKELKREVSELKKRSAELEEHLHFEDHVTLIQNFSSLTGAAPTRNWSRVSVGPPSYDGTVRRAVAQMFEDKNEMKKLFLQAELKAVQRFAVDVTLDPDTANPELVLSEDGKQVHHGGLRGNVPENLERFSVGACVVGKQIDCSGRFYFEVQVKGKTDWILGVTRESVNRKGLFTICCTNGYWTLSLCGGDEYYALSDCPVRLSLEARLEKVGVFVDYREGLVSFYNVDAAHLLYTFTGCSFTEKLLPFFCPSLNQGGKNSAPLVICPR